MITPSDTSRAVWPALPWPNAAVPRASATTAATRANGASTAVSTANDVVALTGISKSTYG